MMTLPGNRKVRLPDFETKKGGLSEYWEIKFRSRPYVDTPTGVAEYSIPYEVFADYVALWKETGSRFWIVVYDAETGGGTWFRSELQTLMAVGRRAPAAGYGAELRDSWIWPVASMEVQLVTKPNLSSLEMPVFSDDEPEPPVRAETLRPFERLIRRRLKEPIATPLGPLEEGLKRDERAPLDVLAQSLGLVRTPRYSVLFIGDPGPQRDDLLGLLDYGIRLFLITPTFDRTPFEAFWESRLLEFSIVPEASQELLAIVDGDVSGDDSELFERMMARAEEAGGLNTLQYKVVHAPANEDVLVTAGAGTGKTETMAERLIFLLSTAWDPETRDIQLREVALVTFTREAAREMRQRIARSIMVRQRLCPLCIHPTPAWLSQLGQAQISTIHMFAKRIIQSFGAPLGIGPGFSVSQQSMGFRRLVDRSLSGKLPELFEKYKQNTPAMHLWQKHIEAVWNALENNGVGLISLGGVKKRIEIVWQTGLPSSPLERDARAISCEVIEEIAPEIGKGCLREQTLRTGQLVPTALEALKRSEAQTSAPYKLRYLFVDEFQDTDLQQMELLLEIRRRLRANLFVVGDSKQGIYRFRGASGDAFQQLARVVRDRGEESFLVFGLTRNFRTQPKLLDSLHPIFAAWGERELLPYESRDRLLPSVNLEVGDDRLQVEQPAGPVEITAANRILGWQGDFKKDTKAILCRENWQAMKVQEQIRALGGSCRLMVGGTFFTSEAVREMRVLLEAVLDPQDNASLLELCETRWAGALLSAKDGPAIQLLSWKDRFASLANGDDFIDSDLDGLRNRVLELRSSREKMSAVAFIVDCIRKFSPHQCGGDDKDERRRYAINLDHLMTLIDEDFAESSVTLGTIHRWLQIKIATDRSQDEPPDDPEGEGVTTALTVHKSKGLEFDRVLIPYTDREFGGSFQKGTRATVVQADGKEHLYWRWKPDTDELSNQPENSAIRSGDQAETRREETRLLYVAMTRAKRELLIYRPSRPKPECWWDLLEKGGIS